MWDLSQPDSNATSPSTGASAALEFGTNAGRLPYLVAMGVSIFGGLCVLMALVSGKPPPHSVASAGVAAAKSLEAGSGSKDVGREGTGSGSSCSASSDLASALMAA